jgi:nucleoid DNA-binding protein
MPTKAATAVAAARAAAREAKENRRFSPDFLNDVAMQSRLPVSEVRKMVEALFKVVTLGLKEKQTIRIPGLVMIRIKEIKAKPARSKKMFGQERILPAHPGRKRVRATVLKRLRDSAMRT